MEGRKDKKFGVRVYQGFNEETRTVLGVNCSKFIRISFWENKKIHMEATFPRNWGISPQKLAVHYAVLLWKKYSLENSHFNVGKLMENSVCLQVGKFKIRPPIEVFTVGFPPTQPGISSRRYLSVNNLQTLEIKFQSNIFKLWGA